MLQVKNFIYSNPLIVAAAAACLFLIVYLVRDIPVSHPPGVLVGEEPAQVMLPGNTSFIHEGFFVTPLAEFEIEARVLGKRRYRFDRSASISPIDLALGWGRMSDSSVIERFSFRQGRRWVHYRYKPVPLSQAEINRSMANMHMVPANSRIERQLKSLRRGEIVAITGKLVLVEGKNGFRWRSSLSRTDTGDGACEIIFVEYIETR
ncbi:MAG: hypothetical protein LC662_00955 [Rhodothermaceae bacterium]|nr:hypothetical protein [Rhodothermaceae bacterium]